ncbi:MAG: YlxR family protein [Gaiellaceae bacterium]
MSGEPLRKCIACGRRAPQRELVRFVARDGLLTPVRRDAGRGAYTCRRLACFERAVARRAFSRTLRAKVKVETALAGLYTEELHA